MSDPRQPPDELDLKKRARRRLVGAVAFATFAAVVLPMIMDETPPPAGQDIDLRIPGQDQVTSSPLSTGRPVAANVAKSAPASEPPVPVSAKSAPVAIPEKAVPAPAAPAAAVASENTPRKAEAAPSPAKQLAKAAPTASALPPAKAVEPAPKKEAPAEARRAQAILEAQPAAATATEGAGAHVVLIGAFTNAANVKNIQAKLGQLGIKTYTENLESAQGRKTRVRAGPFANRDAAEKALEKMKRIGVSGVVAARS